MASKYPDVLLECGRQVAINPFAFYRMQLSFSPRVPLYITDPNDANPRGNCIAKVENALKPTLRSSASSECPASFGLSGLVTEDKVAGTNLAECDVMSAIMESAVGERS